MLLFGGKNGLAWVAILNFGLKFRQSLKLLNWNRGTWSLDRPLLGCSPLALFQPWTLGHWRLDTGFDMGYLLSWGFELRTSGSDPSVGVRLVHVKERSKRQLYILFRDSGNISQWSRQFFETTKKIQRTFKRTLSDVLTCHFLVGKWSAWVAILDLGEIFENSLEGCP